jgi:hypothetical protein
MFVSPWCQLLGHVVCVSSPFLCPCLCSHEPVHVYVHMVIRATQKKTRNAIITFRVQFMCDSFALLESLFAYSPSTHRLSSFACPLMTCVPAHVVDLRQAHPLITCVPAHVVVVNFYFRPSTPCVMTCVPAHASHRVSS